MTIDLEVYILYRDQNLPFPVDKPSRL